MKKGLRDCLKTNILNFNDFFGKITGKNGVKIKKLF